MYTEYSRSKSELSPPTREIHSITASGGSVQSRQRERRQVGATECRWQHTVAGSHNGFRRRKGSDSRHLVTTAGAGRVKFG